MLSFLLFFSIYVLAPGNSSRIALFFLLTASAFFLKGRRIGRIWLVFIVGSILAGHFIPAFHTGYTHFDILTACIYLLAQFIILENYETFKEKQDWLECEQEMLRRSVEEARKLNQSLEAKVQERTRELVAAQAELVFKEKLAVLERVADTVGHELRNPLGVMNNAVYFLQTVLSGADDATREYLGIIEDEIGEAERIVSGLLDAVRTKPPQAETVSLGELIRAAVQKCSIPPSVTVTLDVPERLAPVRVDPHQMRQVFWNLVTNAVEAMPEGGTLEIRVSEDAAANTVTVAVRDSGGGITEEDQARLFAPLFTTKPRRVGLGLVVVKNLTQVNGGRVTAVSEPGRGSTFAVTLPAP